MVYLVAVSLIWAFSFVLFKGHLVFAAGSESIYLDTNFLAFGRMFIALPLFLVFLRKSAFREGLTERLMLIGAIQYGVMYISLNQAYQYLPAAHHVALFTIFTPLFVTVINDIYSRRVQFFYIGSSLLAVIGAAIIKYQTDDFNDVLAGFTLLQISNACFAFGQIEYRRVRKDFPDIKDSEVYALLFIGGLIITGLATSISGGWGTALQMSASQWQVLVYLGLLASGLGFFFWNKGATMVNPGTLAVFNNLKIPLAVAASLLLQPLGEEDYARLVAGTAIMMLAVVMAERHSSHVLRSPITNKSID